MKYLVDLQKLFHECTDKHAALAMKKYMKNRFEFLGIKSPERRELIKEFVKDNGWPSRERVEDIVVGLYSLPYREFHYTGMEIADRLLKKTSKDDIYAIEYLLEYNQWWDSIDFIATHIVGRIFKQHPELINKYFNKWNESNDMWLNRTVILFQLKYKKETDLELLTVAIKKHAASKEFFHRKAIGWSLREYAKTDPEWVINFVEDNELSNLSRREALRNLKFE